MARAISVLPGGSSDATSSNLSTEPAMPERLAGPWLETLRLVAANLGPRRGFQTGVTFLLRALRERHGFLRPHLILFEPETGLLRLSQADTPPRSGHEDYAPGVGVTGRVFATGKPVIVERMRDHPLFLSLLFERTEEELDTLAFLSVPVLAPAFSNAGPSGGDVIGTLNADTPFPTRETLELCRLFLETAAALIANEAEHMRDELSRQRRLAATNPAAETGLPLGEAVARFEKVMLTNAMIKTGGNMLQAARELKTSYRVIHYKIKKYGLDPQQFTFRGTTS